MQEIDFDKMKEEAVEATNTEIVDNFMKLASKREMTLQKGEDVTEDLLSEVMELSTEMIKFVHSQNGIGLMANQIGVYWKFGVFLDYDKWIIIINPKFFPEKKKIYVQEKILNFGDTKFTVERAKKITAVYWTIKMVKDELKMIKVTRKLSGERAYLFQSLVNISNGVFPDNN